MFKLIVSDHKKNNLKTFYVEYKNDKHGLFIQNNLGELIYMKNDFTEMYYKTIDFIYTKNNLWKLLS